MKFDYFNFQTYKVVIKKKLNLNGNLSIYCLQAVTYAKKELDFNFGTNVLIKRYLNCFIRAIFQQNINKKQY